MVWWHADTLYWWPVFWPLAHKYLKMLMIINKNAVDFSCIDLVHAHLSRLVPHKTTLIWCTLVSNKCCRTTTVIGCMLVSQRNATQKLSWTDTCLSLRWLLHDSYLNVPQAGLSDDRHMGERWVAPKIQSDSEVDLVHTSLRGLILSRGSGGPSKLGVWWPLRQVGAT